MGFVSCRGILGSLLFVLSAYGAASSFPPCHGFERTDFRFSQSWLTGPRRTRPEVEKSIEALSLMTEDQSASWDRKVKYTKPHNAVWKRPGVFCSKPLSDCLEHCTGEESVSAICITVQTSVAALGIMPMLPETGWSTGSSQSLSLRPTPDKLSKGGTWVESA